MTPGGPRRYTTAVTTIKTYVGEKQHERGMWKMVKQGWTVTNTVASVPARGCLWNVTFGLLFRSKTRFVVTFTRPD